MTRSFRVICMVGLTLAAANLPVDAGPDATRPAANRPAANRPAANRPAATPTDATHPDAGHPERRVADAGRSDTSRPNASRPGAQANAGASPSEAPQVGEVVAAAYRASGLDRDPVRGLIRRARVAGLIPWLTIRTGRDTSWQDQLAAGSVATDGIDHGTTFEVRATWRLDRLVFDGRELQVAGIEAARRRERRRLATRVIRTYFTWKRAIANVTPDTAPTVIVDDGPRARLVRAEEAAAELDALTDGWFSEELANGPKRGHGE